MEEQRYVILSADMKTTTSVASVADERMDVYGLNNEIKSRCANLRGMPYGGGVRIEWLFGDCEMAPEAGSDFDYY